ncbi:hypothetical protein MXM81_03815 [Serratia plymuthica]|uniref:hypothetical protein n=1 Tax=Serratia plymuthica TaxID=82996 RepID=UPI002DBAB134|nr:hypothetical protein [Serratia plymuthica]MEB6538211.1 hypothetical protein [Serratia plymuthica]
MKTFISQQRSRNHRQREPLGKNLRIVSFHFPAQPLFAVFVMALFQATGFFKIVMQSFVDDIGIVTRRLQLAPDFQLLKHGQETGGIGQNALLFLIALHEI